MSGKVGLGWCGALAMTSTVKPPFRLIKLGPEPPEAPETSEQAFVLAGGESIGGVVSTKAVVATVGTLWGAR
jgi:hypothetical protein